MGIICVLILCIAFCCFSCCVSSANWKAEMTHKFESASKIEQTTLGPVEYSTRGEGPIILCLHGMPGIHDGALNLFDSFVDKGFKVLCPSRPGYGRTPAAASYAESADLMAALLDVLQIDRVAVYGVSGGGPTSIQFAARHPNKCSCLILESAVTGEFTHHHKDLLLSPAVKTMKTSPLGVKFVIAEKKANPQKAL